jgi:capsid portal protein
MGIFDRFKAVKTEVVEGYQSFSTPFGKIGGANLSLPYVNGRYQVAGYIPFGQDNLFPETLNQLYFTSPLHGAIVDFKVNATIGAGYDLKVQTLTADEKLALYTWEKKMRLAKSVREVTKQLVLHNRVYFKLYFDDKNKIKKIENVSPEKVRINQRKDCYFLCDDWASRIDVEPVTKYHPLNTDKVQLYAYEIKAIGQDYYPLPTYSSALNFAFLSGELSYFAKSNIQNSIFPAFAMMFPKRPQSEEEKKVLRDTIDRMKGAQNAGKGVAFFANSADQLPKIESIPTNQNDKLFQEASGLNTEQICFAHTIDPILMGVRTTGSLGNGADIKQAYIIFEKNVVIPLREMVEEVFTELLAISKLKADFSIKNFQIINETIVEVEGDASKTQDALNAMSPLVATKVLNTMTTNEVRALASLPPIEGGDVVPTATPATPI